MIPDQVQSFRGSNIEGEDRVDIDAGAVEGITRIMLQSNHWWKIITYSFIAHLKDN